MKRVVIEGGISRDHLVTAPLGAIFDQPGGPGLYASIAAAATGRALSGGDPTTLAVELWANLPMADLDIRAELERRGVDLSHCVDEQALPNLWILNSAEGRRIVNTAVQGGYELNESDTFTERTNPSVDSAAINRSATILRSSPRQALTDSIDETQVLVDPDQREVAARGWEYFAALATSTTVFTPSRLQLSQLGPDVIAVANELRHRTGVSVVARLDAEGSLVLPAQGGQWRVWAQDVEVVDTTGAGDTHAGALAAALAYPSLTIRSDVPRLVQATIVATCVVAHNLKGLGMTSLAPNFSLTRHALDAIFLEGN
ncbi:PfkB family carbohydrate kinase [Jonesiaceae bacterium BS-20]|uniref:PfkB family carbohydrate kinase n=1 Tax=Jonesiaceae bacterium BS-20 TaxID=3120821 RepID=A0AAU7DUM1_9MICO